MLSTDGGATWTTVPSGVPGSVAKAAFSGGDLYLEKCFGGQQPLRLRKSLRRAGPQLVFHALEE
ncbi:hypothetical protein [Streptomyces sp. 6-11-2]|uniref:hypothetical protein n=1 Tax=Streptomyces sp. 6-11-2 TaxID=2585753 RepID=UPI0011736D70|nr:hypothetical protein [Streptomyces sp. 6-11-2]GED90669.1 hypothetical protein TNCT6_77540 [Streptomyces sp. 6-11-2]